MLSWGRRSASGVSASSIPRSPFSAVEYMHNPKSTCSGKLRQVPAPHSGKCPPRTSAPFKRLGVQLKPQKWSFPLSFFRKHQVFAVVPFGLSLGHRRGADLLHGGLQTLPEAPRTLTTFSPDWQALPCHVKNPAVFGSP